MRPQRVAVDRPRQARCKVRARCDGGRMSSEGDALQRLAACITGQRDPRRCERSLRSLLGQGVFTLVFA